MKTRLAIAATLLVASTAAWAASSNASPNACFGQDRAEGVAMLRALFGPNAWGQIASERKGTNSDLNAAYRDACQP